MFPTLAPAEIERLRRFGELRAYQTGEYLARTAEVSPGMFLILAGGVSITQRDARIARPPIVVHGPGSFLGELAQLAGRPALVDGIARSDVETLVIPTTLLDSNQKGGFSGACREYPPEHIATSFRSRVVVPGIARRATAGGHQSMRPEAAQWESTRARSGLRSPYNMPVWSKASGGWQ